MKLHFITGGAGNGKSWTLNELRTKETRRNITVAPTGIAAINVGGVTIHSAFKIDPSNGFVNPQIKYGPLRGLEVIYIDEVSMVSSELMESVYAAAEMLGVQEIIAFGDLAQLKPVKGNWFFEFVECHQPKGTTLPMSFHVFYAHTWRDQYYLRYDSEATMKEIIDSVLTDPVRDKMDCPAIILNRFKPLKTRDGFTIKNRYSYLDYTTGFFGLDVDGTGVKTQLVKQMLFDNLPEVKLVWVSSSGNGVKAIGYASRLCNLTPERFRSEYTILSLDLRYRSGMRINFDQAMNRCHQPIFINSDPNALHR